MRNTLPMSCFFCLFCFLSHASAHYLWVTVNTKCGDNGAADIIFEEAPMAGDGYYLDHFTGTSTTWFRSVEKIQPRVLATSVVVEGQKSWLRAQLPEKAPRSMSCYGKFGVYRYGNTNVLLHYYAKNLDVHTHEDLHELGRAEHMDLDIVPHDRESEVELTVLWRRKPASGRMVYIRGPKKFRKNLKTDNRGTVRFTPANPGEYTFRTSVEENVSGRDGGQDYSRIRHNATLIMTLPLQE